ncbi:MAG: GYD domain-containing protein [Nitrospiraceae bacterium]|nr:GYD domain-containing protein [Nitrospiraceae bacterium]
MATYIILSTLTDEGRKTLKHTPERMFEVNRELEKMGVKVKEQFATLGPYDFVNIVEAPDNETILRMSVELGARGSVHMLSLAAIPAGELVNKLHLEAAQGGHHGQEHAVHHG